MPVKAIDVVFQFLIGKVKSKYIPRISVKPFEFQFLIGKVKSNCRFRHSQPRLLVSIPYR